MCDCLSPSQALSTASLHAAILPLPLWLISLPLMPIYRVSKINPSPIAAAATAAATAATGAAAVETIRNQVQHRVAAVWLQFVCICLEAGEKIRRGLIRQRYLLQPHPFYVFFRLPGQQHFC